VHSSGTLGIRGMMGIQGMLGTRGMLGSRGIVCSWGMPGTRDMISCLSLRLRTRGMRVDPGMVEEPGMWSF